MSAKPDTAKRWGSEQSRRWPSWLRPVGVTVGVVAGLAAFVGWLPTPEAPAGGPGAGPAAALPSGRFVLRDVRVFDGERVLERATVWVADGLITRVAEAGSAGDPLPGSAPAGAAALVDQGERDLPVIDGRGRTLLPGLIDAHSHSWGDALERAVVFGVTTQLDQFGDVREALRLAAEQVATYQQASGAGPSGSAPAAASGTGRGTAAGTGVATAPGTAGTGTGSEPGVAPAAGGARSAASAAPARPAAGPSGGPEGARPLRADLFSAGTLVTRRGGHGTQFGIAIPTLEDAAVADAFVAARLAEGSAWIKLVIEDGHELGLSPRWPTLDRAAVEAVVGAARRRGALVVAHVHALEAARMAVEAGVDGLVHTVVDELPDPALAAALGARGGFVVPTLSVLAGLAEGAAVEGVGAELAGDPRLLPWLRSAERNQLRASLFPRRGAGAAGASRQQGQEAGRRNQATGPGTGSGGRPGARPAAGAATQGTDGFAVALQSVARWRQAGVRVLAGTDAGNAGTSWGVSQHGELSLLVAAGLSPTAALAAATSEVATAFRLADRGRIVAGQRADLLLVDGNPTTDITATRAIVGVWKDGRWVPRPTAAGTTPRLAPQGGWLVDFRGGGEPATPGVEGEAAALPPAVVASTDALMGGGSTVELTLVGTASPATGGSAGRAVAEVVAGGLAAGTLDGSTSDEGSSSERVAAGGLGSPGRRTAADHGPAGTAVADASSGVVKLPEGEGPPGRGVTPGERPAAGSQADNVGSGPSGGGASEAWARPTGWLRVTGTLREGFPYPWAGMLLVPARVLSADADPRAPVDLAGRSELRVLSRGAGYRVLVLVPGVARPFEAVVPATADWEQHRLDLGSLGVPTDAVGGIVLAGGPATGGFTFEVAAVGVWPPAAGAP
jgi:imidazolonepropionase-like amidohydrolase